MLHKTKIKIGPCVVWLETLDRPNETPSYFLAEARGTANLLQNILMGNIAISQRHPTPDQQEKP